MDGLDCRVAAPPRSDRVWRYLAKGWIRLAYIPEVLVKMRVGGESNRSLSCILRKSREDYRALRKNSVGGVRALVWKNLSTVGQFEVVDALRLSTLRTTLLLL